MKRSRKKLNLNRETIGKLTGDKLVAVVGGSGVTCAPTDCNTMCFICPASQTNCSKCASDCDTCITC